METLSLVFEWLVSEADAIVFGVLYFFAIILLIIAFVSAGGDDYWAEGGMPLSTQPTDWFFRVSLESLSNLLIHLLYLS